MMRAFFGLLPIVLLLVSCHERLRPNEVVLAGDHPRLVAGAPVLSGGFLVGYIERVRRTDEGTRVTVAFLHDSQPALVADSVRFTIQGLGQAAMLEIRSGPQRPLFGPGGYIPDDGSPR